MECPCDEILQMAEHWGVAGCSPRQSSLAAVPAGLYQLHAYVRFLLGSTPCALNGLPHHSIQEQSPKKNSRKFCKFIRTRAISICVCRARMNWRTGLMSSAVQILKLIQNMFNLTIFAHDVPPEDVSELVWRAVVSVTLISFSSVQRRKHEKHHPGVSLGDQFAFEVLHNNSSATLGRDAIHS